jgi:hypothetical protein
MVRWYDGTMVQWYNGTMVQWYNGTVVQWYNGTMVQWKRATSRDWGYRPTHIKLNRTHMSHDTTTRQATNRQTRGRRSLIIATAVLIIATAGLTPRSTHSEFDSTHMSHDSTTRQRTTRQACWATFAYDRHRRVDSSMCARDISSLGCVSVWFAIHLVAAVFMVLGQVLRRAELVRGGRVVRVVRL